MSRKHISITSSAVNGAVDSIVTALQDIRTSLDDLDAEIDRLDEAWSGEAKEAYRYAQRAWMADFRDLHGIANQVIAAASTASLEFSRVESANAGVWR
ncbi:WXG100 family type VII secretion target [Microbacterium phyllosphaerae]|uniref:WXG100 family type VII secretion target n=1 Tax=Microbacterium phyllosphaerae TaxID=124798 RepID=UPI003D659127